MALFRYKCVTHKKPLSKYQTSLSLLSARNTVHCLCLPNVRARKSKSHMHSQAYLRSTPKTMPVLTDD